MRLHQATTEVHLDSCTVSGDGTYLPPTQHAATADNGKVKLGGTGRLPPTQHIATGDSGKVKIGGTGRLPKAHH